jgi:uncharacterized membrane protein
MAVLPVRKIATAGVLSAVAVVLGVTRLGMIPWFAGASLTIAHVPVIIGAILEGPIVGAVIGFLFGLFSLVQAAIAPNGPVDAAFVNPLISILPRILVGPAAALTYALIAGAAEPKGGRAAAAVIIAAIAGTLTNTVLVLGGLGVFQFFPWSMIGAVAIANGPPEAAVAAVVSFAVIAAWKRLKVGGGRARVAKDEGA